MNTKDTFPNQKLEDEIICQNYANMNDMYKHNNTHIFGEYLFVPDYYKCNKNFVNENKVIFPEEPKLCDRSIVQYRGQNNKAPTNIDKRKNDFLIPLCNKNTYQNSIVCDDAKCCSKSHQLFMNMTKRQ